ncbi:MAG: valine--tRNA ligase, partial [Lachnospiraceae bacterium]|nr:valine--tRNA ligase [Lachnospiraceae bacterium]
EIRVERIKEAVRSIRSLRTDMNVAPGRKASVYVVSADPDVRSTFESSKKFFATLASASEVLITDRKEDAPSDSVSTVTGDAVFFLPLKELVDVEKEKERLLKEKKRLENELARSNGMLSNPNFLNRAPAAKIAEEREKCEKYLSMMKEVENRLQVLS